MGIQILQTELQLIEAELGWGFLYGFFIPWILEEESPIRILVFEGLVRG